MFGMRQDGSDGSTNNQAGRDIVIYQGLSLKEAREVALGVYHENAYRLAREASDIALARVQDFTDKFLGLLYQQAPDCVSSLCDPDMQYALVNAEIAVARTGDDNLAEMLVDILLERAKNQQRSLMQVVLSEATTVVPKLMEYHWDILSLIFVFKYTINNSVISIQRLQQYLTNTVTPLLGGLRKEAACYQHLEYVGCASIQPFVNKLEEFYFKGNYSGLFFKGFTKEDFIAAVGGKEEYLPLLRPCLHNSELFQINALNSTITEQMATKIGADSAVTSAIQSFNSKYLMSDQEVKEYLLQTHESMNMVFDYWEGSNLNRMTLTSVGIALATANLKRRTGETTDLSIWIQ